MPSWLIDGLTDYLLIISRFVDHNVEVEPFTSSCKSLNSGIARNAAISGSVKMTLNLRLYCFRASLRACDALSHSSLKFGHKVELYQIIMVQRTSQCY